MEVPSTEIAKRFSQYRQAAQREPVGVTHYGGSPKCSSPSMITTNMSASRAWRRAPFASRICRTRPSLRWKMPRWIPVMPTSTP